MVEMDIRVCNKLCVAIDAGGVCVCTSVIMEVYAHAFNQDTNPAMAGSLEPR